MKMSLKNRVKSFLKNNKKNRKNKNKKKQKETGIKESFEVKKWEIYAKHYYLKRKSTIQFNYKNNLKRKHAKI